MNCVYHIDLGPCLPNAAGYGESASFICSHLDYYSFPGVQIQTAIITQQAANGGTCVILGHTVDPGVTSMVVGSLQCANPDCTGL